MAPSTYLSLFLTISMIYISHAISPTSTPKLYDSVCKELVQNDYEPCVKLLEAYPQITSANDYLNLTRLFLDMVAIDKATKAQLQVNETMKKYPSSLAIKDCANDYNSVVVELQTADGEEPALIYFDVDYANHALQKCVDSLANEKVIDTSISTLNSEMDFVIHIALKASQHLV